MSNLDKYVGTSTASPLDKYLAPGKIQSAPQSNTFWDRLSRGAENVTDAIGNSGVVSNFGDQFANLANGAKGLVNAPAAFMGNKSAMAKLDESVAKSKELHQASLTEDIGSGLSLGSTVAGIAAPETGTLAKSALQFGGLAATQAGGSALAEGKDLGTAAKDAAISGTIGAATGGVFNLLGKGIAKAAPSIGSFTSGVPKAALEQTALNPSAAREGLNKPVEEIRDQAVQSLQTLHNDLGKEFADGLKDITDTTGQTKAGVAYDQTGFLKSANAMRTRLTDYSRDFAREFKLGTAASPDGIQINFDKSPITKPGEQRAVQDTFKTISTWDDFSAKGLQDLAERVGSLRNFESGAKTESSTIVSKIYNKITGAGGQSDHGLISKYYPQLASLRTNYAQNRKVLDEIGNVLGADKTKPVAVQSSVSRLSNLFKEDKDAYLNAVRELGNRSGVDFLSLLAGTEAKKVLPGFVRGLGGGGSVAIGASVLNPYLLLLAPLFSPRAVGAIARNAGSVGDLAAPLIRSASTQAIPQIVGQ